MTATCKAGRRRTVSERGNAGGDNLEESETAVSSTACIVRGALQALYRHNECPPARPSRTEREGTNLGDDVFRFRESDAAFVSCACEASRAVLAVS